MILTLFVGLLCFTYQAKAQWTVIDPSNLVQNIKSAVQSSTTATNMVKSLQESIKIYNQSKAYYDALKSVHNIIKDARKVKLTLEMVSEITEIYTSGFNRMVSDPNFTVDELAAISAGYARLLEEGGALVAELKTVITGGNGLSLSTRSGWTWWIRFTRRCWSTATSRAITRARPSPCPSSAAAKRATRTGCWHFTGTRTTDIGNLKTEAVMDFDNLHQVLRNLYQEMMPLCGDMIGVAKGIAGLGALFYVAYRVWKALANAEPIDVFPLLRPFAIGLCVMFFPTVVLGTINAVMSPVVQGTHAILEGQTLDLQAYQQQKDDLEAEARRREGKAWLVDDEVYEQRLADMGITDLGEIISMWAERTWYDIKAGFRQLVRDFFELLFNAAGLTIDTLRTFFLVVLSILGPLSFALSIYDGFHSTLASWISRYISVYLWLPIADLFSAVLAKIQTLMLQADVLALQDPNYIPDSGSGVYIIFLIIGIIGYFTIPTVAEWVIQSGGAGGAMGGINKAGAFATGVAGGIAGNMIGRTFGRRGGGGSSSGNGGGGPASGSAPNGRNLATQGNSNHS